LTFLYYQAKGPNNNNAEARIGRCIVQTLAHVHRESALVAGNKIPRIVAHRCVIEVSIGKHIESPHSPGHRSNHRSPMVMLPQ
jgi:hypothetical protein